MTKLVEQLINERDNKLAGSLYYRTQITFSYNSNHMEGTRLTEDQTQQIYDTGSVFAEQGKPIYVDDVLATVNHFQVFNYLLDTVEQPLTPEYTIKLHQILKKGTKQEYNPRFNYAGFKQLPNQIGTFNVTNTASPKETPGKVASLFKQWEKETAANLANFAKFHRDFELIHPFSDGNGRVGRLLLFKELCRRNQTPLIIEDINKPYYLRGLREFENTPGYLVDTLGLEQDKYQGLINYFYPE
uniref:Oligopeptide ABC transporter, periplasmic oligopeptide-binding protein OppA (TC 3.A.1.5.1) n=1 Tax=Loigolactobacillus rennini TaxID=238013 RepID=A0A1K2I784_9LACO|nr:Oligopeptide ABC transporter, periplasmic oligopeptide-binding protein OppA (TC 3.A.1.5.1) [Loigolactobacillus rennini]